MSRESRHDDNRSFRSRTIYCNAHAQQNELSVIAATKKMNQPRRGGIHGNGCCSSDLRQRKSRHQIEVTKSVTNPFEPERASTPGYSNHTRPFFFLFFLLKTKFVHIIYKNSSQITYKYIFNMVLIITEVLLEACFSEVPKLFNQPIIRFF